MNIWKIVGVLYTVGLTLVVRDKYREREQKTNMPDSIEDQLDIAIHTTQINELSS